MLQTVKPCGWHSALKILKVCQNVMYHRKLCEDVKLSKVLKMHLYLESPLFSILRPLAGDVVSVPMTWKQVFKLWGKKAGE